MKASFFQEIEKAADYHSPSQYKDLLTFFSNLQLTDDSASDQFVGLTGAKDRRKHKPFIIGILPPTSNVTGRLLDRSASVGAWTGNFGEEFDMGSASPNYDASELTDEFYDRLLQVAKNIGANPEDLAAVLYLESGLRSSAVFVNKETGNPVAKGLNQLILPTAKSIGMTEEEWNVLETRPPEEQLEWVEKYFLKAGGGKPRNWTSAGHLQVANFATGYASKGSDPNAVIYRSPDKRYEMNKAFDKEGKGYITVGDVTRSINSRKDSSAFRDRVLTHIENAKARQTSTHVSALGSTSWAEGGSAHANRAAKDLSKVVDRNLNNSALGQRFLEQQSKAAAEMQRRLKQMQQTPPLLLLVNPQTFSVNPEVLITDDMGRDGPIVENFGFGQDVIEASGRVAAFYAMDVNDANGPGLTRTARHYSISHQNLMSLWLLYRSNGGLYMEDFHETGTIRATRLSVVGSVYIYYDENLYIGSFNTFSMSESADSPFSMEYSFNFNVRHWFPMGRSAHQPAPPPRRNFPAQNPEFPRTYEDMVRAENEAAQQRFAEGARQFDEQSGIIIP